MIIVRRIATKLRLIVYDHIFRDIVFGYNKRPKSSLNNDFKEGRWNYLESLEEKARYDKVIELYEEFKQGGSILDIGCGQGVLYQYLQEVFPNVSNVFCGIDIAEEAVSIAKKKFPVIDFRAINFEQENLNGKFDVVIFNESLYYFGWPLKTLEKCVQYNLNPDGIFIVSMHDYYGRNKRIWKHIDQNYTVLSERTTTNKNGQTWDTKAFKPR